MMPPIHYCPDCDCWPCQCDDEAYDNGDRCEDVEAGIVGPLRSD
jgi:hypothetical protein